MIFSRRRPHRDPADFIPSCVHALAALIGAAAIPLSLAAQPTVPGPKHDPGAPVRMPTTNQSPAEALDTLPGFKLELLMTADPKVNGSWINMAKDPQGRLWIGGAEGPGGTRGPPQGGDRGAG